jgi:ubiquinone/menaquinone biosynthesis C-methylase UbiE
MHEVVFLEGDIEELEVEDDKFLLKIFCMYVRTYVARYTLNL